MRDIWGSSSNDMWVVGDNGWIVHFDGQQWSGVQGVLDSADEPNGENFSKIHGSSPNNVWILGTAYLGTSFRLLHFDGKKWAAVAYDGWIHHPSSLWVESPTSVWIFGEGASHFDGNCWTDMDVPLRLGQHFYDSVGFSDGSLWIAGDTTASYWDGKQWTDESEGLDLDVSHIWGATPDDIWAIGYSHGGVFRKLGATPWQPVPPGIGGTSDKEQPYLDVNGTAVDDVLLSPGAHFNGTGFDGASLGEKVWPFAKGDYWHIATADYSLATISHQSAAPVDYNTEAHGVILATSPNTRFGYQNGQLAKFVGDQLVSEATKLTFDATVTGNADNDIWVTANDNTCNTSHYNGVGWTKLLAGPGKHLPSKVAQTPNGTAFVGCGPQLSQLVGGVWKGIHTFATDVIDVAANNDTIWVVTVKGVSASHVFENTGGIWTELTEPVANLFVNTLRFKGFDELSRPWLSGGSQVGWLENGTWHQLPGSKSGQITVRGTEAWLVSDALYRVATDGSSMKSYASPCGLATPVIAGPGDVWFAGAMDCHVQIP